MSQVPATASQPTPLTADELARARETAYFLALKRGGGQLPPYRLNHANGDFWQAAATILAQRATSHSGQPAPVLCERDPRDEDRQRQVPIALQRYATSDGTATAELDFTPTSGALTFGPGETSKTVSAPAYNDQEPGVIKTVMLPLTDPRGGAVLGNPAGATLTILEVQAPPGPGPGPGPRPVLQPVRDVTGLVSNRRRKTTSTRRLTLFVTNVSGTPITGRVMLVLDRLPRKVRLTNATGATASHPPNGSPFVDRGPLAPGKPVTVTVRFKSPTNARLRFGVRVLAGEGPV
jgi:hypothetical protein